jgi:hypothetical protein
MSLPKTCVPTVGLLFLTQVAGPFAAAALAQGTRPLDFRTIALHGHAGGTLAVVDGQPRLVSSPSAWNEWTLHETRHGWTIRERQASPQPRYLSVDTKGEVTLVAEPDAGAYWRLTPDPKRLFSFDTPIQAAAGKFKDWHLSFLDQQESIERNKHKYAAYRVVLSEKPGPRANLHIFIDGP